MTNYRYLFVFSPNNWKKYFLASSLSRFAKINNFTAFNLFFYYGFIFGPLLSYLAENSAIWQQWVPVTVRYVYFQISTLRILLRTGSTNDAARRAVDPKS
jgi:hypothetical protein